VDGPGHQLQQRQSEKVSELLIAYLIGFEVACRAFKDPT
jgi:hypothetical protein